MKDFIDIYAYKHDSSFHRIWTRSEVLADTKDYYVKSTKNSHHELLFRYLLDEQNVKVGKVFVDKKIVVFDDQELVALLDYRSNRRHTLPSPKLGLTPSDGVTGNSIITGITQTAWVTYMFEYTGDTKYHSHPCNYFNKITSYVLSGNSLETFIDQELEKLDGVV